MRSEFVFVLKSFLTLLFQMDCFKLVDNILKDNFMVNM